MTAESAQTFVGAVSPGFLSRLGRGIFGVVLGVVSGVIAYGAVFLIEWGTGDLVFAPALLAVLIVAWYTGLWLGLLTLVVALALTPAFAVLPQGAAHSTAEYLTATVVVAPLGVLTAVFGHLGRRAAISLRRSEHLFHSFMGNLPGAAWMKGTDGRYVYANDEAVRIFKTPRADLYGKGDEEIFAPGVARQFVENDRLALVRRDAVQTVEALQQDDGVHQSLVVKFPILDARRSIEFIGGVAIDITDRHRVEQELAQRSEQLQLVMDAVPALVSYVDRDERYVLNSRMYEDWFGYSVTEMQGKSLEELLGEERYAAMRPYVRRALEGEVVEYEAQAPDRGKGPRWIEAKYVPHKDREGNVAGFFSLVLDVTVRKQLEIERSLLSEVSQQLSETLDVEETARGLIGALAPAFVDGAAIYFAEDGHVRGVTMRGGIATAPESVDYDLDMAAERGIPAVFRTGRGEYYRAAPDALELPGIGPETPRVSAMLTPIVVDGKTIAVLAGWTAESKRTCEAHDFELQQEIARRAGLAMQHALLYEESRRIAEELRVANNAKDEFLGTVSHELRTPITVILGNASLLANRHQQMDDAMVSASLGELLGQAERLHRVVENMLILARLESGDTLELEPILIARTISQVIAEAQRQQPGRIIRMESSDWDLFALGAESYVHQVLLNYLNNAIRYSPATESIDVAVLLVDGEVQVKVLDRGVGLVDEDIEGLFTPFYRSRSGRIPDERRGLGIGLSVSKRLVEAQGGAVWARHREDGGGAEFGLSLPAVAGREPGDLDIAITFDGRSDAGAQSGLPHNE